MSKDLPAATQQGLLALLIMDPKLGTKAAALLKPEHFDQGYQDIATRVLGYREEYHKPPGWEHIDELFGRELEDSTKSGAVRRRVEELIALYEADRFNPEYVVRTGTDFVRWQALKAAVLTAAQRVEAGGELKGALGEVESILQGALSLRSQEIDAGVRLSTAASFGFLEMSDVAFPMGIEAFDEANAGATHEQVLLYLAPKGTGKTWFCVHMGRQGFKHRGKVLHISLEWPVKKVLERYVMMFWNASRYEKEYTVPLFSYEDDELADAKVGRPRRPEFIFRDAADRKRLAVKIRSWGARLDNIVIKDFPSGSLSLGDLIRYLDYLEQNEGFVPDMLIIDYPRLMRLGTDNLRLDLGQLFVNLRGLCQERKMAGVFAHQSNRRTIHGKWTRSQDASEDISVVQTADTVVTYSQTEREKETGTARLLLEHTREGMDGIKVVVAQAYRVGQYVVKSRSMTTRYWNKMLGKDEE